MIELIGFSSHITLKDTYKTGTKNTKTNLLLNFDESFNKIFDELTKLNDWIECEDSVCCEERASELRMRDAHSEINTEQRPDIITRVTKVV